MSLYFTNMLLGRLPTDVPKGKGRVISFAGSDSDIRLTTGTMRERVLGYLYLNRVPATAREIASGIKSNPSRVTKTLKDLIDLSEVESVKHEGCVTEYVLKPQGLAMLKASEVFAELKL
jgi:predicted transcriptional regulator with HTH domain